MRPEFASIRKKIQTLTHLLSREARAIRLLDWKEIEALAARKLDIVNQLEPMLAHASAISVEELHAVQKIALDNAGKLQMLKEGVARARERIAEMTDASELVGVYAMSGRPVKARFSCANDRNA